MPTKFELLFMGEDLSTDIGRIIVLVTEGLTPYYWWSVLKITTPYRAK